MTLFDHTFIEEKGNIIFLGPPRAEKTHLAIALVLKACQAGISIYFTNMDGLIKKLKKDHEEGRPGKGRSYYKSSLVIVDEVGYTPIIREKYDLFFRFAANRYERSSTINIKGNSYRLRKNNEKSSGC
ncbi:MAG: ATP-binding protein [Deltaproteobacteria bacterium]|jgi:DNA replication protein DnaC|nr:ATP-binding protein [Deltaproteobacteria bacterium]